jgi:hypothetical protein
MAASAPTASPAPGLAPGGGGGSVSMRRLLAAEGSCRGFLRYCSFCSMRCRTLRSRSRCPPVGSEARFFARASAAASMAAAPSVIWLCPPPVATVPFSSISNRSASSMAAPAMSSSARSGRLPCGARLVSSVMPLRTAVDDVPAR